VERLDEIRRGNSLRKNNSAIFAVPRHPDLMSSSFISSSMMGNSMMGSKTRNISALMPKQATSIILSPCSSPFQQVEQMTLSCPS